MSDQPRRPRFDAASSDPGNGGGRERANGHATATLPGEPVSLDLNSSGPLPPLDAAPGFHPASPDPEALVWERLDEGRPLPPRRPVVRLDGGALLCGCPDCGAPMTVRLWLMRADCWRCGTGIELSEEMIQEAERAARREAPVASAAPIATPARRFAEPEPAPMATPVGEPAVARVAPTPAPPTTPPPAPALAPPVPPPGGPEPLVQRRRRTAAEARAEARTAELRRRPGVVARAVEGLFGSTPAWVVSALIHFVLLTVLALLSMPGKFPTRPPAWFVMASAVDADRESGGDVTIREELDATFDLPIPTEVDLSDTVQREALIRADQDARELRLDPDAVDPSLRNVEEVRRQIRNAEGPRDAYLLRDPRLRAELVTEEGGTTLTEAAVARALRWLAQEQQPDGSWSLQSPRDGAGQVRSDSAATSLALLPFLGAGQTHTTGIHRDAVSRGLRRLLRMQKADGDLRDDTGQPGMYAHGQGAIVLCEAYAMTRDEAFREPAQKAIDFIVAAQHDAGGWRYAPKQPGDTSVVGWQLMALQSARAAGLDVPETTYARAQGYLDSVLDPQLAEKSRPLATELASMVEDVRALDVRPNDPLSRPIAQRLRRTSESTELLGGEPAEAFRAHLESAATSLDQSLSSPEDKTAAVASLDQAVQALYVLERGLDTGFYAYQPGQRATHVMTAEALLCRVYLGWDRAQPGLETGLAYCQRNHPPDRDDPDVYYWYYATQSMHHLGGSTWDRWNAEMRDVLVQTQEKKGRDAGSWEPRGEHASAGGRIYMTSLAACSLEVYYRHLPIFKQIEIDGTTGETP